MVGGGQLARMTHQAAIALGQSLRVLAADADRSRRPGQSGRGDRLAHRPRRAAPGRRGCRRADLRPRARARPSCWKSWSPRASTWRRRRRRWCTRRTNSSCGDGWRRWAPRCRVTRPSKAPIDLDGIDEFARRVDRPDRGQGGPGRLRRSRACRWPPTLAQAREIAGRISGRRRAGTGRGAGRDAPRAAALVARSPFGQGAAWPVVETVQRDGICVQVIAPAPALPDATGGAAAQQLALRLAAELGVVGVLAVELFETTDGQLLVNELAMRPHNSGHWTMDGSRDQSVRAASARGARLPARRHRRHRAGDGDGQRAGRRRSCRR